MPCFHPVKITDPKSGLPIEVPCGKCIGCLSNNRSDWAYRLQVESTHCDMCVFFTLTYNELYVPICHTEKLDSYHETERIEKTILRLKDVQEPGNYTRVVSSRDICLFMKRLRRYYPYWLIRYFITSEYGPKTFRPHYHGLLFLTWNENYLPKSAKTQKTLQIARKFFSVSSVGHAIEHCWSSDHYPLGFVSYRSPSPADVEYVGKYCTKENDAKNPTRTWQRMSKEPYIGYQLLQDPQIVSHIYNRLEENDGKLKLGDKLLPRIYQRKQVPTLYQSIYTYRREQQQKAIANAEMILDSGSLECYDRLSESEKKYVDEALGDVVSLKNYYHERQNDLKIQEAEMTRKHKEYWLRKSEYNEFLPIVKPINSKK